VGGTISGLLGVLFTSKKSLEQLEAKNPTAKVEMKSIFLILNFMIIDIFAFYSSL
jgi:Ni,Fe-hydrogenase I cytochrome b subunit